MTSPMHEGRLAAMCTLICGLGARSVIDLGCGEGDLLVRLLAEPGLVRVVGLELDAGRLAAARIRLGDSGASEGARLTLVQGSMLDVGKALGAFDCAVMLETIEHLDPGQLSVLERAVFGALRAAHVIITTPNADMNARLGVPPTRFRHPEHRFEWGREKFERWAGGVAGRWGYTVEVSGLGGWPGVHPGATQMAVFSLAPFSPARPAASAG